MSHFNRQERGKPIKEVSWPERLLALVVVILLLPILLEVALFVRLFGGRPVLVKDEQRVGRCYRFRTTGPGGQDFPTVARIMRRYSVAELPGIWSVVLGDNRLKDFLKWGNNEREV